MTGKRTFCILGICAVAVIFHLYFHSARMRAERVFHTTDMVAFYQELTEYRRLITDKPCSGDTPGLPTAIRMLEPLSVCAVPEEGLKITLEEGPVIDRGIIITDTDECAPGMRSGYSDVEELLPGIYWYTELHS